MSRHLLRLAIYLVAVAVAYWWAGAADAGMLFEVVVSVSAAVVGLPALLLSLEGIGESLGLLAPWSQGLDDVEDLEQATAP